MAQVVDNTNLAPPAWERVGSSALFAGIFALAGLTVGCFAHLLNGSEHLFYQAYMYGWIFWMAVTLGCFILMLLTNVVRATWGFPVLRLFEAGAKMLPIMGVLFLPIFLNVFMGKMSIYPWADYATAHADDKMWHRYAYMNPTFWAFRSLLYFCLWSGFAYLLPRLSVDQDRTRDGSIVQQRINLATAGFVLIILTGTFAYVDWVMSLDRHWYSTIYGAWFLAGATLTALSFVTILASSMRLQGQLPYLTSVTPKVTRDWGNLMLTLCMVWAYFSVSQYIITWSGNLPEEIVYYIQRNNGTTAYITTFLVMGMFFGPFLALLSGRTKRVPTLLRSVAIWIFGIRVLESFWNIVPFYQTNLHTELITQFDLAYLWAIIGIGGLWLYMFFYFTRRNTLVSVEDSALLTFREETANAS